MNFYVVTALLAASLATALYKLQFFLIYPSSYPSGSRTHVEKPDEYGMPYEEVKLLTPDGEYIRLYVIVAKSDKPSKTVLFLGPNAGNMGNALPMARLVWEMGHNVVLLSYRGYGLSTGSASEKGLKIDADTALNYIREHPRMKGSGLVLYGRSLGGAVAIYAGASAPPGLVSGIILENTFTSIPKLVPAVLPLASFISGAITEKWESYKLITQIPAELPVMFLAGGQDELIPPKMFKELHDLCSSKVKLFYLYPKGQHNDTVVQPGYWEDVAAFLNK